jgi:hypothetical protein
MNVSFILLILLIGALATYTVGDKLASKVALLFGLVSLGASIVLLNQYNLGENIGFITEWISKPTIYFALKADGLALAMLLLTTALTPIIIYSSFGTQVNNAKTFYALILFMAFAMAGTFLAADGLLYYIFWELSLLPIYFIALVWGNGDAEERKKAADEKRKQQLEEKNNKKVYLICYNEKNEFATAMKLVEKTNESGLTMEGGIDKRLTIIKTKYKESADKKSFYEKSAFWRW